MSIRLVKERLDMPEAFWMLWCIQTGKAFITNDVTILMEIYDVFSFVPRDLWSIHFREMLIVPQRYLFTDNHYRTFCQREKRVGKK